MEQRPNESWEDPWLAGKRAAEEARTATFDGEPPEGHLTRRACVLLGAKYMAACAFAALVLPMIAVLIARPDISGMYALLLKASVIVLTPAGLVGALIAFETYKMLMGLRPFREIKWYVWLILFFICLQYIILPFLIQYLRRKWIIFDGKSPGWLAPIFYSAWMLFMSWVCYLEATRSSPSANKLEVTALCMFGSVLCALFLGDCLIVNALAKARDNQRLLPPPAHNFQFSLGAMLATVLGLGTYVSALVLIFRGK